MKSFRPGAGQLVTRDPGLPLPPPNRAPPRSSPARIRRQQLRQAGERLTVRRQQQPDSNPRRIIPASALCKRRQPRPQKPYKDSVSLGGLPSNSWLSLSRGFPRDGAKEGGHQTPSPPLRLLARSLLRSAVAFSFPHLPFVFFPSCAGLLRAKGTLRKRASEPGS